MFEKKREYGELKKRLGEVVGQTVAEASRYFDISPGAMRNIIQNTRTSLVIIDPDTKKIILDPNPPAVKPKEQSSARSNLNSYRLPDDYLQAYPANIPSYPLAAEQVSRILSIRVQPEGGLKTLHLKPDRHKLHP